MPQYYFAIASKQFLVDTEPVEEILRERSNYYQSTNKDIDFWFTTNPKFIHLPQFQYIKKKLKNTPAAIISLDEQFIEWIKLRINFVTTGKFQSDYFE
uniref:hypothetical protein n=1 Tax=Caulacanthus ustulatus TaxID=31411 RepID=UPI0027DA3164|nr:hypothetical protein REQ00_pgp184 [Caulacanthus ustulatus]WCH57241.1 hypothetical protein [Caulacanthus ustulatus]